MRINDKHYETVWLDENDSRKVKIIDQRKLPFEFSVLSLEHSEDVFYAIKDMAVRGAPLIGVTAAFGLYLAVLNSGEENWEQTLEAAFNRIGDSRPTAVNLFIALERVRKEVRKAEDHVEAIERALNAALDIMDEERENSRLIGVHGLKILEGFYNKEKRVINILTHCNAGWLACIDYGTATAPVYSAFDQGIPVHVWVDETRPRNQGARLTAYELGQHGVPHTIITDNAGGHLMQHGMVDLVIVGSDRTTSNGDVANKIGTYLKALAAKENDIPFYVALPTSTIDYTLTDGIREIPIEERNADEIRLMEGVDPESGEITKIRIAPEGSEALNYGFDVTPAKYISGYITERGIWSEIQK